MRGGARQGSGRKKGSVAVKTNHIAAQAAAEGITPLEVMLKAMRLKVDENDWTGAASIAKDAAPYMHARLQSVEQSGPGGGAILTEIVYRWGGSSTSPPVPS